MATTALLALATATASCATPNQRLTRAAYVGDRDGVAAALASGEADVNARAAVSRDFDLTPLVAAIFAPGDQGAIARLLLAAGADPNARSDGYPLLTLAIREQKWGIAHALLEHGADPHAIDRDGDTPLGNHLFGYERCAFLEVPEAAALIDLLLGAGPHPDTSRDTLSPVLFSAVRCRDADLVRRLLAAGARVEHRGNEGMTPLLYAADIAAPNVVRVLLQARADLDATTHEGIGACALANRSYTEDELKRETMAALTEGGADCQTWTPDQHLAHTRAATAREAAAKAAKQRAVARPHSREDPVWNATLRGIVGDGAKAPEAPAKAPAKSPWDVERDTTAYDHARACPQGGTFCGESCCGSGMICCVPDGAVGRKGGVCKAAQAGHGCWWGTHQER